MKEEERAERLARAIDELLQGNSPGQLDDSDLSELLRVAKARMDAADKAGQASVQHEGEVWEQLLRRLGHRGDAGATAHQARAADGARTVDSELNDVVDELRDVIALRRQMAEQAAALAEQHRDAVWQRVAARIQSQPQSAGALSFSRHGEPDADTVAAAVDSLVLGEPIWEANDTRLEELLQVARTRRLAARATVAASRGIEGRLWARLRPRLAERGGGGSLHHFATPRHAWSRLAAAAAVAALFVAAVGPIPATGLAHHPAVEFARFIGEHVGVTESASQPPVSPVAQEVQGTDVSPGEAADLLGLPVRAPARLPEGFELASSTFFPRGVTSQDGMLLLAYANGTGGTVLVFQEGAGGDHFAAAPGSAQDVTLADGTPATFIEGGWQAEAGEAFWSGASARSLVFEREGVRTTIQDLGGSMVAGDLGAMADGMAPATP